VATPEIRRKKDDELFATIADGKGSVMPAWRGLLTDQDIRDVPAYLRALGG
jgi:mono/diheme cytochrome c family protein